MSTWPSPDERPILAKTDPKVPLPVHLRGVATTARQIAESPVVEARLNGIGSELDATAIGELAERAALYHDTGKAHPEWQQAAYDSLTGSGATFPGHSARSSAYAYHALPAIPFDFEDRLDMDQGTANRCKTAVMNAIANHHTPLTAERMDVRNPDIYSFPSDDAGAEMAALARGAVEVSDGRLDPEIFSVDAVTVSGEDLHSALRFYEDQDLARIERLEYGLVLQTIRSALIQADHYTSAAEADSTIGLPEVFDRSDLSLFPPGERRPFQRQIDAIDRLKTALGLAGCGEGKTHSALQWFGRTVREGCADRLVLTMPTRITSNNLATSLFENVGASNIGLYHGGSEHFLDSYEHSTVGGEADGTEQWDTSDPMLADRARKWFQNPVTVCTVDHVLRTLVNGYPYAKVARANLARSAVVFDELHAYDGVLLENVLSAMRVLTELSIPWYVMTATLPSAVRESLPDHEEVVSDGRLDEGVSEPRRPFYTDVVSDRLNAPRAVETASTLDARRVMVVKNTVAEANTMARTLREMGEDVTYYSSEIVTEDRPSKESDVTERFGLGTYERDVEDIEPVSPERRFLITTQICELSLDLSADLLLSDVAPMDAILQRAGRLHRAGEAPDAMVCTCDQCRASIDSPMSGYRAMVFSPLNAQGESDEDPESDNSDSSEPENDENGIDRPEHWLPYASERDSPMWRVLERTAGVLEREEVYDFPSSVEWIDEAYDVNGAIAPESDRFAMAVRADWIRGQARRFDDDGAGQDELVIRDITNYRVPVYARTYRTSGSDRDRDVCDIWIDEYGSPVEEFGDDLQGVLWAFSNRYAVDIPVWWLSDESLEQLWYFPNSDGLPVVNVTYSYEAGIMRSN